VAANDPDGLCTGRGGGWLVIGVCGLLAIKRTFFVAHVLFRWALSSECYTASAVGLFAALDAAKRVLPLGLPDLPFHLGSTACLPIFCSCSVSSATESRFFPPATFARAKYRAGLMCLEYHACLASMALLLIADDAYVFYVAWGTMTLTATLLVTTPTTAYRKFAMPVFFYMLISHIGALALLLCFGLLQANTGDYTFSNMRQQHLDVFWASITFFLALFGFGAKAGILPLHVWLPEAHPAAPSPISALMSAFVLKTGMLWRACASRSICCTTQLWWWGVTTLAIDWRPPCSASCSPQSRPT